MVTESFTSAEGERTGPPVLLRRRDMPPDNRDENEETVNGDDEHESWLEYDKYASSIDINAIRRQFPRRSVLHDWPAIRKCDEVMFNTCIEAMKLPTNLIGKFPVTMPAMPSRDGNILYDWSMWRGGRNNLIAVKNYFKSRQNMEKSVINFNNSLLKKAEPCGVSLTRRQNTSTWGSATDLITLPPKTYDRIHKQLTSVNSFVTSERKNFMNVYFAGRETYAKRIVSLHRFVEKDPQLRKKAKRDLYEYVRLFRPDFYICHLADYNMPTEDDFIKFGEHAERVVNDELYQKYGRWLTLLDDGDFNPHELAKEFAASGGGGESSNENTVPDWVFEVYDRHEDTYLRRIMKENEADDNLSMDFDAGVVDYNAKQRKNANTWRREKYGGANDNESDTDDSTAV
jgi:hypothetical protein